VTSNLVTVAIILVAYSGRKFEEEELVLLSRPIKLYPKVAFFSQVSPPKLYAVLFPIRATCPAHLNLSDLITQMILGEDYRAQSLKSRKR
jgi:hypothetical protein